MKRCEVEAKLADFMALIDRQQVIREELLRLKMWGHKATDEDVAEKIGQQQKLIDEMEQLREGEMLPILEGLAQFIRGHRAPAPWKAGWQNVRSALEGD